MADLLPLHIGAGVASQGGTIRFCPGNANSVCYSVGVPTSSADSQSGNIYFQISAPATYQWVALGTGTGMAGSNMFIVYQDGSGNVTVSPRIGANHVMPTLDTSAGAAQLTVLEGSGVSEDGSTMTANVRCANCESWSGGGELSLKSTESSWIGAWRRGNSLATTSRSAGLVQHDDTVVFEFDLTKAALAADSNPFVAAPATDPGGGGNTGGGSGGGGSEGDGDGVTVVATDSNNTILVAHGVIMAIVFVILYPLGALLMPTLGRWWAHAGFQAVVWLLMWAGFGLGIKYAKYLNIVSPFPHPIPKSQKATEGLTCASSSTKPTPSSEPWSSASSPSSRPSATRTTGTSSDTSGADWSATRTSGTGGRSCCWASSTAGWGCSWRTRTTRSSSRTASWRASCSCSTPSARRSRLSGRSRPLDPVAAGDGAAEGGRMRREAQDRPGGHGLCAHIDV